jgi:hypothetical protein
MQQMVEVARNAPCPCGSGRKFKKCCLDTHAAAVAGDAAALDVAALVNAAIETDDWKPVDPHVDRALALFARGAPLEHVRFRDDLIGAHEPAVAELTKLCTAGWLNRCQLELARVLDHYKLAPGARDGLRMAVHLLRRFGARSPVVEELVSLQIDERNTRVHRIATALSASGLTADAGSFRLAKLIEWLDHHRPPLLTFADWFALRTASDELFVAVWLSGVSSRLTDHCLDRLDDPELADRQAWVLFATISQVCPVPQLGEALAMCTPLRAPTADERLVYEALQLRKSLPGGDRGIMFKIIDATEARGDFAGAALLRETMRLLQHDRR